MTARKSPFETDLFAMFTENMTLLETLAHHAGMFKAQAELLNGMEEITRDWLQCRSDDNESATRAAERIFSSGDASEMLVAYCDWLGGTVRRFTDSATDLSEKAFAVTASATKAGTNGASAAKSKPKSAKPKSKPKAKAAQKAEAKPAVHVAQKPAGIAGPIDLRQRLAG